MHTASTWRSQLILTIIISIYSMILPPILNACIYTVGPPPILNAHCIYTVGQPPILNAHCIYTVGPPPILNAHCIYTVGPPPILNMHTASTCKVGPPQCCQIFCKYLQNLAQKFLNFIWNFRIVLSLRAGSNPLLELGHPLIVVSVAL